MVGIPRVYHGGMVGIPRVYHGGYISPKVGIPGCITGISLIMWVSPGCIREVYVPNVGIPGVYKEVYPMGGYPGCIYGGLSHGWVSRLLYPGGG